MGFHWPKSRFFYPRTAWEVDRPNCWVNTSDDQLKISAIFWGVVCLKIIPPKSYWKIGKVVDPLWSNGFRSTHGTLCSEFRQTICHICSSMTNNSKLPLESSGYPKMDSGFGHGDRMGSCSHPILFLWYLGVHHRWFDPQPWATSSNSLRYSQGKGVLAKVLLFHQSEWGCKCGWWPATTDDNSYFCGKLVSTADTSTFPCLKSEVL